jgi:hypothetical protein
MLYLLTLDLVGIKKGCSTLAEQPQNSLLNLSLFRTDCFHRTGICACAAVCTQIGIDDENVSFTDRSLGALIDAYTASCAFVRNYVSHIINF